MSDPPIESGSGPKVEPRVELADRAYCEWLVEVVFATPDRAGLLCDSVEFDGHSYRSDTLLEALLTVAGLVERVEARYEDPLHSMRLVDYVFPRGEAADPEERKPAGPDDTIYSRSELFLALQRELKPPEREPGKRPPERKSPLRDFLTLQFANDLYCRRLADVVFPVIGPRTDVDDEVEIDGRRFNRAELYAALLLDPELQQEVAERYHYYSDEMYCEWLLRKFFPPPPATAADTVKLRRGETLDAASLRKKLRQDPEYRAWAEKKLKHPRSQWLMELYCDRLVEVAFPERVLLEKRPVEEQRAGELQSFDRKELREGLEKDPVWRTRIARGFRADPRSTTEALLDKVFPPEIVIGGEPYSKAKLRANLPSDPALQQRTAAKTYYVPSKWILEREMRARRAWSGDAGDGDIYRIAAQKRLTGVCFSGGGIRSATFNLGILQGLAQLGLLPHIDYLSSVSGGGYIHEFLAGWILRNGDRSTVIEELIPQAEPRCMPRSPEPIQWLKRYASYLTPARGLFSTDTWTVVAIWLRNTILNQVPILAAFACGMFLVHLLVPRPIANWLPGFDQRNSPWQGWTLDGFSVSLVAVTLYALVSVALLGRNLSLQERHAKDSTGSFDHLLDRLLDNGKVVWGIILPWLCFALWLSYWVQMDPAGQTADFWKPIVIPCALILAMVEMVIFLGGAPRAYRGLNPHAGWWRKSWAAIGFACAGILAAAVAIAIGWAGMEGTRLGSMALSIWIHKTFGAADAINQSLNFTMNQTVNGVAANVAGSVKLVKEGSAGMLIDSWRIRLAVLPGLLLSVPYVAIEITVGLVGRDYSSMRREWLARLRAWSMLYAILWGVVVSLVLLGPYVGYYIEGKGLGWIWTSISALVISHGATVYAGWSGKADGKATDNGILGIKPVDLLALVAAPIAIVTMLLLLSFCASVGVDRLSVWLADCPHDFGLRWRPFVLADLACLAASALVWLLLGWRVDINEFSMHAFYKNRLSRSYLGATVPGKRQADPFTGFDDRTQVTEDDGRVRDHPPCVRDLLPLGYRTATGRYGRYDGPFPIFCTTLNLTTGGDLATQERKGTSFAFTPLYSGYSVAWTDGKRDTGVDYNGYVPTEEYAYTNGGIHLDSAVAISGAALNPNQGYNSNPALAFLMTFFNVRLGWWISNPRNITAWPATTGRSTPQFALLHLFKELFGMVGDATEYVNLSDGGHFENMGLYELIRRRCKYIVVCDAEADPEMKFEGMGSAITKCRADFGAEIDLDLRPLQLQPDTGFSKTHCVVGTVRYPPPRGEAARALAATECRCLGETGDAPYTGVIVYLKSSLVGDEPADLLTHKLKYEVFPQDSTANQWFTETLFEAYRRLGHHVALTAIQPALPPEKTEVCERSDIQTLFEHMYAIWYPRTPEMDKYIDDHLKQYEDILAELRDREELAGLEARLNDERSFTSTKVVVWLVPAGAGLYPIQFAHSLLNFMYTVYTDLQLAFPDNRNSPHAEWLICLFRRWSRVTLVRAAWISHTAMHTEEFRLFAQRELKLP